MSDAKLKPRHSYTPVVSKSSSSDGALRGMKTVGFIGLDETARAILKGIAYVDNNVGLTGRSESWARGAYIASVPSAASARQALWGDTKAAPPQRATKPDILEDKNVHLAVQSDLIILASPPDTVRAILSENGIALALSGKVVVSMVAGVTIDQMYDALYSGNRSPSPVEGSERCFIFRARPNLAASIAGSATLLVPMEKQTPPPPKSKINLVEKFFKGVGVLREIEESQIDVCAAVCAASSRFLVMLSEELIGTAVDAGTAPKEAERIVVQSLSTLSQLLTASPWRPSELRSLMCESSWARVEGKLVVEQNGARKSIGDAIREVIYPLGTDD